MIDGRKYRKMPDVVMLRKVENWSFIHIRNRISTKFNHL